MILTLDSPNTTRIPGRTPFEINVAVSQFVFGRGSHGIILADVNSPLDALASLALTHHPFDGPIFLVAQAGIDPVLLDEIRRLASIGTDSVTQAILVGPLGQQVEDQLISLGLRVTRISGINAYHTAAEVARFLGYPSDMILVSGQDPQSGLVAGAMAAHRGIPVVFTLNDTLPQETAAVIKAAHERVNAFIIGGRNVISDETEKAVRGLADGTVSRISGEDLLELSVRFAKYKSADGRFGFGKVTRHGHAFTFVNPGRWQDCILGAMLARSGKHAPILFLARDEIAPVTQSYLLEVNPAPAEPEPPYMHAFIIGDFQAISPTVQLDIEDLMSIDQEPRRQVVHTVEPHETLMRVASDIVPDVPHMTPEQSIH